MLEQLLNEQAWLFYFISTCFFLAIGSLLNVFIHRIPLMLQSEWREQCMELLGTTSDSDRKKINLFFPRSFCPNCKNTIPSWQNIPVLSYVFLRGRCYYCKTGISMRYPLVEILTLILSLYALFHFGLSLELVFSLLFVWICICLIFIDMDHQLLPDNLTLSLLWAGLIANTMQIYTSLPNAVLSAAGAWLALWSFIQLFYLITGKIGMGHGDFKLFAAFGAWFGWTLLPLTLIMASLSGAVIGSIVLKIKKKNNDTPIPFGPFLAVSGIISLFWGQNIMAWYLSFY